MAKIELRDILVILSLIGLFFSTNFQTELGLIFLGMLLAAYAYIKSDPNNEIGIQKKPNINNSIILAIGAYLFFIFTSSLVIPIFYTIAKVIFPTFSLSLAAFNLNSIVGTFSQTNLILAGSMVISFISLAFFIAPTETLFFFVALYEYLLDKFRTKLGFSFRNIAIILIISGIFTLFHITAKGITANEALILTFYFAIISLVLVNLEKQGLGAIFLHIIANLIASLPLIGVNVSGFIILIFVGLAGGLLYFITKGLKLEKLNFMSLNKIRGYA